MCMCTTLHLKLWKALAIFLNPRYKSTQVWSAKTIWNDIVVTYSQTPSFAVLLFVDPTYSQFIKCDLPRHLRPRASRIRGSFVFFHVFVGFFAGIFVVFHGRISVLFYGVFDFPLWITNRWEPIPPFSHWNNPPTSVDLKFGAFFQEHIHRCLTVLLQAQPHLLLHCHSIVLTLRNAWRYE